MPFFLKREIIARMQEKRAEMGDDARADFNLALLILGSALFENRLKSGKDYGTHPVHVAMANTRSDAKQIIGILHDVVEDSDWVLDDLRAVGFSERIVAGVDGMTHRPGELYFDSIQRCGRNPDSLDKKIEDLSHNMDMSRTPALPKDKDMERLKKYIIAHTYLVAIKKGDIPAGTPVFAFVIVSPEFAAQRDEAVKIAEKYTTKNTPPKNIAAKIKTGGP